MKLSSLSGSRAAFTLIEIAIAIAVIGFALVAIIGILPRGLEVQRDNRAETIINQDGTFWLEAVRSGARGMDDLLNVVDKIVISNALTAQVRTYTRGSGYQNGEEIIGLLTTQAADTNAEVIASVAAVSGAAVEKEVNPANREIGFKYLLKVNIHQSTNSALSFMEYTTGQIEPLSSLYDLRLELLYPLQREDRTPPRRQIYRSQISRHLLTNEVKGQEFYYFVP